jgi:hypothetical protein
MRSTVSNILEAHENSMRTPEGLYVKNTFEFVDKIKNAHIMPYHDMLDSFDVEALFPSILVDEALELLKKWLEE